MNGQKNQNVLLKRYNNKSCNSKERTINIMKLWKQC